MRILFVHNTYQYRGGEDTTLDMESALLKAKGHTVDILSFNNNEINGLLAKVGTGIRSFYNLHSARQLKEKINTFKPDVIHIHNLFFTASPSILYAARQMNIPVVMTVQNYRLICANALLLREQQVCELCIQKTFPLDGIRYQCYRSSYVESALVTGITSIHKILSSWNKKVDQYIVPSEFLKNKLHYSSLKLPFDKLAVKPNFIQDVGTTENDREDFFLFVGRISPEKGVTSLVKCFANNPASKLVIAGDGPDKEMLIESIKDLPNITYIGQQPKERIIALMKACKALIFSSLWYEGLPLTIVEAFATGTPVIASKLGAMAEMITDGFNGFHFMPGDTAGMQDKIMQFSALPAAQRDQLYKNARQTYITRYHPDVHYTAILGIYEKAINKQEH
jgi:glycosyltransferase involved in cell wall biosynthesis